MMMCVSAATLKCALQTTSATSENLAPEANAQQPVRFKL